MISRVAIKNFKSIGEPGVDLELKPLTLLVGPNGGGKSSILEAIAVASQNAISSRLTSFPTGSTIIHKPNGSELDITIYFASGPSDQDLGFRVSLRSDTNPELRYFNDAGPEGVESRTLRSALLSNAYLLSCVRGNVPYAAPTGGSADWVGLHGELLLLLLAIIFGQRVHRDTADKIIRWASRFDIGELQAGLRGGNQSGSDYLDKELKVVLDLALSSSGARQIMTVITQLFWAPKGSLLMIEEPEISLHPKAQIDVLEMFAEAIKKDDKQILATTHSHIMLQALGYVVSKGWLSRDDIAVYHVEKGKTGTKAKQLPLGKGGYLKNWVPSYSKVERQLLGQWAKTLPRA